MATIVFNGQEITIPDYANETPEEALSRFHGQNFDSGGVLGPAKSLAQQFGLTDAQLAQGILASPYGNWALTQNSPYTNGSNYGFIAIDAVEQALKLAGRPQSQIDLLKANTQDFLANSSAQMYQRIEESRQDDDGWGGMLGAGLAIALAPFTGGASLLYGALGGGLGSLVTGGSFEDALKSAAMGGALGYGASSLGTALSGAGAAGAAGSTAGATGMLGSQVLIPPAALQGLTASELSTLAANIGTSFEALSAAQAALGSGLTDAQIAQMFGNPELNISPISGTEGSNMFDGLSFDDAWWDIAQNTDLGIGAQADMLAEQMAGFTQADMAGLYSALADTGITAGLAAGSSSAIWDAIQKYGPKVTNFLQSDAGKSLLGAGVKGLATYFGSQNLGDAANSAAQAQIEAARIAADAMKFKPYTVTTATGKGLFDTANQTATSQIAPEYKALMDRYTGQAGKFLGAQEAFNPDTFAQDYFNKVWNIGEFDRNQSKLDLEKRLLAQGMLGSTGGYERSRALEEAIGQERMRTELGARDQAFKEMGLFGDLGRQNLGQAFAIEDQAGKALEYGINIGGRNTAANTAGAQALLQGTNAATQTQYQNALGQQGMWNSFWNNLSKDAPTIFEGIGKSIWG